MDQTVKSTAQCIFIFFIISSSTFMACFSSLAAGSPDSSIVELITRAPSLYVFGASLVDTGENAAAMPRRQAAECSPYGIDYFPEPTGRWSNGRTLLDHITQGLGLGFLSPYLMSVGSNFTHGVNFASSGATAINTTTTSNESSLGLFSLLVQVEQFRTFQQRLFHMDQGQLSRSREHFANSVYLMETPTNDYLQVAFKSPDFDVAAMVRIVMSFIKQSLEVLYTTGARMLIVMNLSALECAPATLVNPYRTANRDAYGCKVDYFDMVNLHNTELASLLDDMREQHPDGDWILYDAYSIFIDGYQSPMKYGIEHPFEACCGAGGEHNYLEDAQCGQGPQLVNGSYLEAKRCEDPSLYLIWDSIHPVDSFGQHLAQGLLQGTHLYPSFNITQKLASAEALHSSD